MGVCDAIGGLIYESDLSRITAEAIVEMLNSDNPPKDWEETRNVWLKCLAD